MFDTFYDLPVHALVVHAVVVLVPLAAAGTILIAARPRLRDTPLGWAVAALAVGCVALTYVARQSGLKLKARLDAGGVIGDQIAHHESYGKLLLWPVLAMAVLAVALVLLTRRATRHGLLLRQRLVSVVALLAVLGAGASLVQVALTGHSGSVAVWKCTIVPQECSS